MILFLFFALFKTCFTQLSVSNCFQNSVEFLLFREPLVPFSEAQTVCQETGGNLAIIINEEVQEFVTDFLAETQAELIPNSFIFFGLISKIPLILAADQKVSDQFGFVTGEVLKQFGDDQGESPWISGQPNIQNQGVDNEGACGTLTVSDNDAFFLGGWNDQNCNNPNQFICSRSCAANQTSSPATSPVEKFLSETRIIILGSVGFVSLCLILLLTLHSKKSREMKVLRYRRDALYSYLS